MRAFCFARLLVALAIAETTACSIWAALSNAYKTDGVSDGGGGNDASGDAGARDARAYRFVDSGISPYAIAAYGDTVYVVGYYGEVQVAHGANSGFSTLWMGDPSETFQPRINGASASDAGVFWTVSAGIHFCALDGGACGFLQSPPPNMPQAIAASDSAVVWVDRRGVWACSLPLDACTPTLLPASKGAGLVTAGSSTLAWADGGSSIIHVDTSSIDLGYPHAANAIGIDRASGDLYWESRNELGAIYADGAAYTDGAATRIWPLGDQGSSPVEFFAGDGVVYWSTPNGGSTVFYCRVDSDAGCTPAQLSTMGVGNANYGIVADSRNVLAIVGSTVNSPPQPELAAWPLPR